MSKELRNLIFRMVAENPTWGAPRIHGELRMLGFGISERTVLRWMRKAPRSPEPAKRWATFLNNHREAITAMDFFTVPTLTFGVLYCFFVISHDRRRILHCNITRTLPPLGLLSNFERRSHTILRQGISSLIGSTPSKARSWRPCESLGCEPDSNSVRSPWQNGVAERFVGSCRRDLLDHVIVLNERHLKRLMTEYVRYYHDDRTHLGLGKQTPGGKRRQRIKRRRERQDRLDAETRRFASSLRPRCLKLRQDQRKISESSASAFARSAHSRRRSSPFLASPL